MKKQPEITALTKNNLINAFWELYAEKGISKVTVGEITVKAGYNRSTFYQYFADVYDLLNQVVSSLLTELGEQFTIHLRGSLKENFIDFFIDFYKANGKYLRVLLGANGDPSFVVRAKAMVRPIIYDIFRLKAGDLRAEYVSEFVMSGMIGTISHWYEQDNNISSEELSALIYPIINNGVLPIIKVDNSLEKN